MITFHIVIWEVGINKTCTDLNDLVAEATELEPFMTLVKEVRRGLQTSPGNVLIQKRETEKEKVRERAIEFQTEREREIEREKE